MTAPDLMGRVVGFRKWRIAGDRLASPYMPFRWEGTVAHARCYPEAILGDESLIKPHDAPHPRCRCGIYAYYRLPERGPLPDRGRVFGMVTLWGRIEAHHDGMRAEHAEISALAYCGELGSRHREQVAEIARLLAVPLVEHTRLPLVAGEIGDHMPDSLIPGD